MTFCYLQALKGQKYFCKKFSIEWISKILAFREPFFCLQKTLVCWKNFWSRENSFDQVFCGKLPCGKSSWLWKISLINFLWKISLINYFVETFFRFFCFHKIFVCENVFWSRENLFDEIFFGKLLCGKFPDCGKFSWSNFLLNIPLINSFVENFLSYGKFP